MKHFLTKLLDISLFLFFSFIVMGVMTFTSRERWEEIFETDTDY